MGTAFADWYCTNADCEEIMDGDELLAPPSGCFRCGSPMEIVQDDEDQLEEK